MANIKYNKYKQISILDFPDNTLIELSPEYRRILFGMIRIEYKTVTRIHKHLSSLSLTENFSRWQNGYDKGKSQLIPLKPLLELFKNTHKTRNSLFDIFF
jgi:hypothetical protein